MNICASIVICIITIRHGIGYPYVKIFFTGNKNSVSLNCTISPFSHHASWRTGEMKSLTECTNSFCTNTKHGSYIFTSSPKGIYVTISPFDEKEIGIEWTCTSSTDYAKCIITKDLYSALPSVSTVSSTGLPATRQLGTDPCSKITSILIYSIAMRLLI